mmetsp:Transcript_10218/g.37850  ORF Transcript_10218/g.37850 Transcript_10218/m.37850 type:complete len:282 (-) Transcript_10218:492-1337(-)
MRSPRRAAAVVSEDMASVFRGVCSDASAHNTQSTFSKFKREAHRGISLSTAAMYCAGGVLLSLAHAQRHWDMFSGDEDPPRFCAASRISRPSMTSPGGARPIRAHAHSRLDVSCPSNEVRLSKVARMAWSKKTAPGSNSRYANPNNTFDSSWALNFLSRGATDAASETNKSDPGENRSCPNAHTVLLTAWLFVSRAFPVLCTPPRSSFARPSAISVSSVSAGWCSSFAHAHATLARPCEFIFGSFFCTTSISSLNRLSPTTASLSRCDRACVARRCIAVAA